VPRHPYLMPDPTQRLAVLLPPLRLRLLPDVGLLPLLPSWPLAISTDQPDAWEEHAVRLSSLPPAGVYCASRNPPPASRLTSQPRRRGSLRVFAASWLPCQHDALRVWAAFRFAVALPAMCRAIPDTRCFTAARAVSSSVRESRWSGLRRSARLPPPPNTFISAAVYRASWTHPAFAERACADAHEHGGSVRCPVSPHVLIASHRGKPPPIVWISHCPGVLMVDHLGLDLIQKKAASVCDPVSLVFYGPLQAWVYGRASASHSFSMRQRRGRCG